MNRREFIVGTMAAAVAAALAGTARAAALTGERFCRACGGPIWRGTRAYVLTPLGRDEQDDYCLSCLAAIREQQTDWEEYLDAFFGEGRPALCRRDRREPCR